MSIFKRKHKENTTVKTTVTVVTEIPEETSKQEFDTTGSMAALSQNKPGTEMLVFIH